MLIPKLKGLCKLAFVEIEEKLHVACTSFTQILIFKKKIAFNIYQLYMDICKGQNN